MSGCEGSWHSLGDAGDERDEIRVMACTGCPDWLVVIGCIGYDVPGSRAGTLAEAVADAIAQRRATCKRVP